MHKQINPPAENSRGEGGNKIKQKAQKIGSRIAIVIIARNSGFVKRF